MTRHAWILAGMWSGALVTVVALWFASTPEETVSPPRSIDGAPVRTPEVDSAEPVVRAGQPTAPPEPGPPGSFRGGRRHVGRSDVAGPVRGHLAWRFETQGRITAQPVLDLEGRIYVGSHDHHVYALTDRGRLRWRRNLGGPIYSTPAIGEGGRLYVGSDADRFVCLASDGSVLWQLDTQADADTSAAFSPDRQRIYFGAGSVLFAVAVDGRVLWRFQAHGKIYSSPAVDDDGTVYVGSQDDHLYALAPDGRLRWSYRARGDVDSSPVIGDGGVIYFGSDDAFVYAVDRDGELVWAESVGGYVRAPVALGRRDDVIVSVFGPRPRVIALDAGTGEPRWTLPITLADSSEVGVTSGPVVDAEGNIYVGAHDDYLYALTPRGRLRWVYRVSGDIDVSPVLARDGTLLVGSDDGVLYAFQARAP